MFANADGLGALDVADGAPHARSHPAKARVEDAQAGSAHELSDGAHDADVEAGGAHPPASRAPGGGRGSGFNMLRGGTGPSLTGHRSADEAAAEQAEEVSEEDELIYYEQFVGLLFSY